VARFERFFFYWCYGKVLAPVMPKVGPLADKYEHAVGIVALGNAVPFVGPFTIDTKVKEFLFCASEVADKCNRRGACCCRRLS